MKKIILKLLSIFGFQLVKVSPQRRRGSKKIVTTRVANFDLQLPDGLLAAIFQENPLYSSEIGRLVQAVEKKYPQLHFIDIGANFGDTAAIVRSVSSTPILCVEGDNACFDLLQKNMSRLHDIAIHKTFLGEKTEVIEALVEKKGWNMTIVPDKSGSANYLNIVSLDDLLKEDENQTKYKVLKIDTEGFDCRIIRGGLHFIRRVKPAITLEYNRENMTRIGEKGLDTLEILSSIGYETIVIYDSQGRFILSIGMSDIKIFQDLHRYANGKDGAIYYYDLCLFHKDDLDIAESFCESERAILKNP